VFAEDILNLKGRIKEFVLEKIKDGGT